MHMGPFFNLSLTDQKQLFYEQKIQNGQKKSDQLMN